MACIIESNWDTTPRDIIADLQAEKERVLADVGLPEYPALPSPWWPEWLRRDYQAYMIDGVWPGSHRTSRSEMGK